MATYDFLNSYKFANGVELKNCIVMAPTTLRSSKDNGVINEIEEEYYRLRAAGPGLLISEVAYVNELGKGFEGQIGASSREDHLVSLKKLAKAMQSGGNKAILQIFGAGSNATQKILGGHQPVSASDIPSYKSTETPRPLTQEEIYQTIEDFGNATQMAIDAGFDGVEIHGANLYLLQQFLSPASNQRTDKWGGSLENRSRLPIEVIKKVIQIVRENDFEDFLVGYRLSPEEPMVNGLRINETLQFAKVISRMGIDYLHLSLQFITQTPFRSTEIKTPVATLFKEVIPDNVALMAAGMVKRPQDAVDAMEAGVDLVALGRELIVEPNWVQKVKDGDEDQLEFAMDTVNYDKLKVSNALSPWLETRFKRGLAYVTDPGFDPSQPWKILRDEKGKLI